MSTSAEREPIFNVPGVVFWLIALMIAIHAWTTFLDPRAYEEMLFTYALIPARYGARAAMLPGEAWAAWVAPFSHMLLHGSWLHLGINAAWLLAFGSIIARRMDTLRFLAVFTLCGLGGAALFLLVNMDVVAFMVGASGAVSGLMGAVFRFLFQAREYGGFGSLHAEPRNVPLMPLSVALTNRRVLTAVAVWLGINAIFATDVGRMLADGEIAWEAHIGGFLVGFLMIGLFDRVAPRDPELPPSTYYH